MTPEGVVKQAVKERLKVAGAYYHMPVMNGYGAPTLDIIGSHLGRYFAIETKAPGKKPTPRQEDTIERIRASGGKVFVIDGDCTELDAWLDVEDIQMKLF
tara:strand:- start:217 stop:516 length:300 start_codon:yes stop_codon:yes gene_type:complete